VKSNEEAKDTLLERMQSGRYVPPRKRTDRVPRYLARVIRSCLQPKPTRRIGTATSVRRHIERGLGRTSPADCRYQIATWLWERGLIQPADGKTEIRPMAAASGRGFGAILHRPLARWLAPVVITSVLIAVGVTASALGVFSRPPQVEPARVGTASGSESTEPTIPEPVAAAIVQDSPTQVPVPVAALPDPALVRFVVWPWAEVQIEGHESFLTPRAEPIELPPGTHRIVFVHPTYGRAEHTIELAAGEVRRIRHVFEEAPAP
jgi:hypothetical protein